MRSYCFLMKQASATLTSGRCACLILIGKGGTISICQSKTSVPLTAHISGRVMNAIADYILNARPKCDLEEVFLSVGGASRPLNTGAVLTNQLDRYCKKAGVRKIRSRSFHSLRRSFAVKMSESDVPIEMISEMLGHTSIDSDKPYLTYNRDQVAFCSIGFQEIPHFFIIGAFRCGQPS